VAGRHRRQGPTKASPATSAQTKGSIGYVEYAYAKAEQAHLHQDDQQGGQGRRRRPPEAVQAAAADADWKSSSRAIGVILANQPGGGKFVADGGRDLDPDLQERRKPERTGRHQPNASKFFAWAVRQGPRRWPKALDYVRCPSEAVVVQDIHEDVSRRTSRTASGKPLYAPTALKTQVTGLAVLAGARPSPGREWRRSRRSPKWQLNGASAAGVTVRGLARRPS
jgi:hypothetical protein